MASVYQAADESGIGFHGSLADPKLSIAGPRFDSVFFWGAPILSLLFVIGWAFGASFLPHRLGDAAVATLFAAIAILTFAHLIAVVPRAYFNREVFQSHVNRLTIVPVVLIGSLLLSPPLLVCAAVLAFFWDVHHSAMQTFGLSRIYDMKAGNGALELRSTDLRLNWALYVGPIAAGASLASHLAAFGRFGSLDWTLLASVPGVIGAHSAAIRWLAIAGWVGTVGWAALDYAAAHRRGYKLPAHKAALLGSTAFVSIIAWGFAPPLIAFATVNLFHAIQYFALVWLKEGGRIRERAERLVPSRSRVANDGGPLLSSAATLILFSALCAGFGIAYYVAKDSRLIVAPFVACSLLHFWYDSFIWSVRKKQV